MTDPVVERVARRVAAEIMVAVRQAKFPQEYPAEAHDEFESLTLTPMLVAALNHPQPVDEETIIERGQEFLYGLDHEFGKDAERQFDENILAADILGFASAVTPQPGPNDALEKAEAIARLWVPPPGAFEGYSSTTAHRICNEIADRIAALSTLQGKST